MWCPVLGESFNRGSTVLQNTESILHDCIVLFDEFNFNNL